MDTGSLAGDVDSLAGGLSLLEPLLERILADSVSQQHGWLRVYGKSRGLGTPTGPGQCPESSENIVSKLETSS